MPKIKIKLKNCPLCGEEPYDNGHGVGCRKCGLWLGDRNSSHEKYIHYTKVWNKRLRGE